MAWFLSYILSVGLSLLVGYGLLVKAMGQSAARRQMSHALPWIVLGFAIFKFTHGLYSCLLA